MLLGLFKMSGTVGHSVSAWRHIAARHFKYQHDVLAPEARTRD